MGGLWVVYAVQGRGGRAVCTQAEWARLTAAKPDSYTFIRGGISHEGEAERLARGTAGDAPFNPIRVPAPALNYEPWYETLAARPIAPIG
jgi:hypothetical protein